MATAKKATIASATSKAAQAIKTLGTAKPGLKAPAKKAPAKKAVAPKIVAGPSLLGFPLYEKCTRECFDNIVVIGDLLSSTGRDLVIKVLAKNYGASVRGLGMKIVVSGDMKARRMVARVTLSNAKKQEIYFYAD